MVVVLKDRDSRLELWAGNITKLSVDAIVNAANNSLLGGGGVDGAIHDAAGPELLAACRALGGCDTGDAKAAPGFALPARYVIHTVGPIWREGTSNEISLLRSCYRKSLDVAAELGCRTVAFPALSTGAFGFPLELAARIAVETVSDALGQYPGMSVTLVSLPARHQKHLRNAAKSLGVACSIRS